MSLRCIAIRALRGTIRAIDWVTSIELDEGLCFGIGMLAVLETVVTVGLAHKLGIHWGLAALILPAFAAALVGVIALCAWLACRYDDLRDWTEEHHRQCRAAESAAAKPPTTPTP